MENTQNIQRYTVANVLLFKFIKWLEKKEMRYIAKKMFQYTLLIIVLASIQYPMFILGTLSRAIIEPKTALAISILVLFFYGKALVRFGRKAKFTGKAKNNQNTLHGVPITELATFLLDTGGFKNDAVQKLGLAQKQWAKIAKVLEESGVVYKSKEQNNARVLRPITREELIMQLRDGFPMQWCTTKNEWITKDGPWRLWLSDEEKKAKADLLYSKRMERKKKRLKKEVQDLQMASGFTRREVAIV